MNTKLFYAGILAVVLAAPANSPAVEMPEEFDDTGEIVEFHIPQGTRLNPWNTRDTVVNVRIGQTLRIFNDDTIVHRLHTNDDKPCEHQPASSKPGEFYDCVIINAADPDVDLMYDHNSGGTGRFYVRALP